MRRVTRIRLNVKILGMKIKIFERIKVHSKTRKVTYYMSRMVISESALGEGLPRLTQIYTIYIILCLQKWGTTRLPNVCPWLFEGVCEGVIESINEGTNLVSC